LKSSSPKSLGSAQLRLDVCWLVPSLVLAKIRFLGVSLFSRQMALIVHDRASTFTFSAIYK
jgi:hypothetical protein